MDVKRIFDLLPHFVEKFGDDKPMISYKEAGKWKTFTGEDFFRTAKKLGSAMVKAGVQPGDKVAIISENDPRWNLVDFATQLIGGISVPIYPSITIKDYIYIFNHAEVKVAFCGNIELCAKATSAAREANSVKHIISFEKIDNAKSFEEFLQSGDDDPDLSQYHKDIQPEDLFTIIYTSGTTGFPKGVMLSHSNLISNVIAVGDCLPIDNKDSALSFLPLCHVFERMVTFFYFFRGIHVYYAESMATIVDDLKDVKPNFFTTAPRMLEKVYDRIVTKGFDLPQPKRALFFWALNLGLKYDYSKNMGPLYNLQLGIARKLIFKKWQEALGGNLKFLASGSAALQPRLARVFAAAGIVVLEGYGLTETSPVVCVNRLEPENYRVGTVGPTIDHVEVKIAEDGEILVKGPNVMMGYYKQPEKTDEVIKDGWFHTGDIGEIQEGRFLKITDRKKEMFKTSGGKYIAPQLIENKLKESIVIEQAIVIGDGYKFPSALINPNMDALKEWCLHRNIPFRNEPNFLEEPAIVDKFQRELDLVNDHLAQWEKIKKFHLLYHPFEISKGELTATMKLRRKQIKEHYQKEIEALYA